MQKQVLGIRIDDVSKEEALKMVESWLSLKSEPKLVFTPGPEFLVTANKDPEFKKILNSSDLNLPDGFGLNLFGGIYNIVPGVDFMRDLCRLAAKNGWTIGLLGGQSGIAHKTAEKLKLLYPGLKVPIVIDGAEADKIRENPDTLPYSDILFVAFGHPKQEKFLAQLKNGTIDDRKWKMGLEDRRSKIENKNLPSNFDSQNTIFNCQSSIVKFRVGVGVGGSFDFISGKVPEPPKLLNSFGLKWLGRFLGRPGYMLPKVFRATVVFPYLLARDKIKL